MIPEVLFGTADAAVAGLDGIGNPVVPPGDGARIVGRRPLAPHFIEAVAEARRGVVPRFHKLARVEVGAAYALVVHAFAVKDLWASLRVEFWDLIIGHNVRDGGAARDLDDRLVVNDFVDRGRLSRIGAGSLHASP